MLSRSTIPRTDRHRGGYAFIERWTNAKAAFIGWLLGRGYSSVAIAEVLDDGTDDATVREMARKWALRVPKMRSDEVYLVVPVTVRQRANIQARAQQEGLGPEEWARQLLVCGARERATFRQVVPEDQFP